MHPPAFAVLGFRPHTYWTAVVALAGPPSAPRVIERRRIEFATGQERFVYHQAAEMKLDEAEALITLVRKSTRTNAAREIGKLVTDLQGSGVAVRVAAVPAGTATVPEALADIVRAHARMHAAEGNFYRDAVASACAVLGIEVHRVFERDLAPRMFKLLNVDQQSLDARLKEMGKALGSPWGEDYRLATEAAWLHLKGAKKSAARRPARTSG